MLHGIPEPTPVGRVIDLRVANEFPSVGDHAALVVRCIEEWWSLRGSSTTARQGSFGIVIYDQRVAVKLIPVHDVANADHTLTRPWSFRQSKHDHRIDSSPLEDTANEHLMQVELFAKKVDVPEPLSPLFTFRISTCDDGWWAAFTMERLDELSDSETVLALRAIPALLRQLNLVGGYLHCDLHLYNIMRHERTKAFHMVDLGKARPIAPPPNAGKGRLSEFLPSACGIIASMADGLSLNGRSANGKLTQASTTMAAYQETMSTFMQSDEWDQLQDEDSMQVAEVLRYIVDTDFTGKRRSFLLRVMERILICT